MKIEQINEYLKDYRRSQTSAKGIGCKEEVIIRTKTSDEFGYPTNETTYLDKLCDAENIVETHFKQIRDAEKERDGMVMYVRIMPELRQMLDDNGEFSGHYCIRTRLQFGEHGKCITHEQFQNLQDLD